jgi:hypothetical protein
VRPLARTSSAQEHGEVEEYPVGKYGHTRIRDLTKYLGSAYKTSTHRAPLVLGALGEGLSDRGNLPASWASRDDGFMKEARNTT